MVHILFWNPDISSMTRDRMTDEMTETIDFGGAFNWSFWEYENVKPGDICYLVRCGDSQGPHGIMLRANIITEAYRAEDWSGKGRRTMYADWYPQEFIDTEYAAPLSPERLEAAMPGFNWRGGHSGRELPKEYEKILEKLWYEYLESIISEYEHGLLVNSHAYQLSPSTLDFWKTLNKKIQE